MNFLTFVFSILLVLSFGTYAAIKKQSEDRQIRSTYLGHLKANRKILSSSETENFRSLRSLAKPPVEKEKKTPEKGRETPKPPPINPECAQLNIWPLIQEGRESHPLLYEMTAKLLKIFYGSSLFENKSRAEYTFLNHLLKKAKEQNRPLEKLSLDPSFQPLYYKMLKGTKVWSLEENIGYPSLLDAIKVENAHSKICLSHAHPDQLSVFFGVDAATKLFAAIHQKNPPPVTKELIEKICSESHITAIDPNLFDLFEFGRPQHLKNLKSTLIGEDEETHISLRKNIYRAVKK